jgi:2,4-dienoyl-CoA reductase-like NADH-dependent reductase (Old Yellow Enzyme family)
MPGPMLFEPMNLRDVTLKNRIVVPPMHQYSAVKGFPTDWHLMNAGKFAAGGAGMVVVESTKVERRGCGTIGDLGIWDDAFVAPLHRLVKFIKQQNAVAGLQLGHSGRKARANRPWEGDGPLKRTDDIDDWDAWQPVVPSAIAHGEKWPVPRALERHEVKDLVQAWATPRAAPMKPASTCWSCTAPTAISCTSSCPSARTSARMSMAAPNRTGCAS